MGRPQSRCLCSFPLYVWERDQRSKLTSLFSINPQRLIIPPLKTSTVEIRAAQSMEGKSEEHSILVEWLVPSFDGFQSVVDRSSTVL